MLSIALAMTLAVQSPEDAALSRAWEAAVSCMVNEAHRANPGAVMPVSQSMTPAREAVYGVADRCENLIMEAWAASKRRFGGSLEAPDYRWRSELKERAVITYYQTYLVPTIR